MYHEYGLTISLFGKSWAERVGPNETHAQIIPMVVISDQYISKILAFVLLKLGCILVIWE